MIVVIVKSTQPEVHSVLKEFSDRIQFDIVTLPDDHDKGTVDSLRLIKNKIKVSGSTGIKKLRTRSR